MQAIPLIPGYELTARLGGGPLADVFAARSTETGAIRAVKVVRDTGPDGDLAILLARREARTLRLIRSPHVVRLRDAHVSEAPYFLVFDLLEGETVRQRLARDYVLEQRTALCIARQIATGIEAVHRAGYVHGDIKPENFQVDSGMATLLDLGFARRPGPSPDGYLLGTANYLAPELCGEEPEAENASDWYSLGVSLFEMLVGRLPFIANSAADALSKHQAGSARQAIGDVSLNWPPRLTKLIDGLLKTSPAARPRGPLVMQELIALEIATLGIRRAA